MTQQQDYGVSPAYNETPSYTEPSRSALREAALEAKTQAGVLIDHAAVKAKEIYRQSKDAAGLRAGEARHAIVERPWAAVGVIFLAGLMLGQAMNSRRAQVVYLKDRLGPAR